MPSGVFKPYSGVATSVVIFTKGGKTERVWFYGMTADGYSLDDKRIPTHDKNDIPSIIKQWNSNKEAGNIQSWIIDYQQIKNNGYNLSASHYKPATLSDTSYEEPSILLEQILTVEREITHDLEH